MAASAGDITSAYTYFDLATSCRQLPAPDEDIPDGSWSCPGFKGTPFLVSEGDDRSLVGFGERPDETCSYRRTFQRFNTALSPVEWRLRDGKPFAVIERWRVTTDDEGATATWLVVTALQGDQACPVHYVAGSFPKANEQARRAADELVPDFNCESDTPTFDSTVGPPGIELSPCGG
jgi:hypothetical protein